MGSGGCAELVIMGGGIGGGKLGRATTAAGTAGGTLGREGPEAYTGCIKVPAGVGVLGGMGGFVQVTTRIAFGPSCGDEAFETWESRSGLLGMLRDFDSLLRGKRGKKLAGEYGGGRLSG